MLKLYSKIAICFFLGIAMSFRVLTMHLKKMVMLFEGDGHIITSFLRWMFNKIFQCHNTKGIKLVTRLRLGLSHLWEHKFKHSFQDTLNPLCSCAVDIETTSHCFLHAFMLNNLLSWTILMKSIVQYLTKVIQSWLVSCYMATNLSRMK